MTATFANNVRKSATPAAGGFETRPYGMSAALPFRLTTAPFCTTLNPADQLEKEPVMASPQLQNIIQMLRQRPRDPNATPQQMRAGFEQMTQLFPIPADVKIEKVEAGGRP